jgi:hypothetical protein
MSVIVPDRLKPDYEGAANMDDPWCLTFETEEGLVYVAMYDPIEGRWEKKEPVTHILTQSGHPLVIHIICKYDSEEEEEEDFGCEYMFLISNCDTSLFNLKEESKNMLKSKLEAFKATSNRPNKYKFISYISRLVSEFMEAALGRQESEIDPENQGQGGLVTPGAMGSGTSGNSLFFVLLVNAVTLFFCEC